MSNASFSCFLHSIFSHFNWSNCFIILFEFSIVSLILISYSYSFILNLSMISSYSSTLGTELVPRSFQISSIVFFKLESSSATWFILVARFMLADLKLARLPVGLRFWVNWLSSWSDLLMICDWVSRRSKYQTSWSDCSLGMNLIKVSSDLPLFSSIFEIVYERHLMTILWILSTESFFNSSSYQ